MWIMLHWMAAPQSSRHHRLSLRYLVSLKNAKRLLIRYVTFKFYCSSGTVRKMICSALIDTTDSQS